MSRYVRPSLRDVPLLRTRPTDRGAGWPDLHLSRRVIRFECSVLTLVYVGLWLLALVFVLVVVW